MSEVPDIISYDGEQLILWTKGSWKVKHPEECPVERQGDVLVIHTPDGQPALAASVYFADMLAQAIETAVMTYYLDERTNGK